MTDFPWHRFGVTGTELGEAVAANARRLASGEPSPAEERNTLMETAPGMGQVTYDRDPGIAKAPSGPPVSEALDALEKRVAVLDEVIGQLYDRAMPIVSDSSPEDGLKGPLPPFGSSVVAVRIGESASRVAYLTDRLQSFTRRLEV